MSLRTTRMHGKQQSKLTLMSESLRDDGRIWVPKDTEMAQKLRDRAISPHDVPEYALLAGLPPQVGLFNKFS